MDPRPSCWTPVKGELIRTRPSAPLAGFLEMNEELDAIPKFMERKEKCLSIARLMISTIADLHGPVIRTPSMRAQMAASIAELLEFYSHADESWSGSPLSDQRAS
jgi:hypothetical protein